MLSRIERELPYTIPGMAFDSPRWMSVNIKSDRLIDARVEAFKMDLSECRDPLEQTELYNAYLAHVRREQVRLRNHEKGSNDAQGFCMTDVVTGDAPYITPFDCLKGRHELLPPEIVAQALVRRQYRLWILNHPTRIDALKKFIKRGYEPPVAKEIPYIDEATAKGEALDFNDIGLLIQPPPSDVDVADSARELLAHGPFTWMANNLPAIPYALSSMPDVSNSLSIATHALSGGLAFVPFDSIWSNIANQKKAALRARQIILNDPILNAHPDRKFLINHYQRLIGITIKASLKSVETVKEYLRMGFTTFRLYDARSREILEKSFAMITQALQDEEFDGIRPKITFLVGQLTDATQAQRLEQIALTGQVGFGGIVGIGAGGICSTPKEAGVLTNNVNVGREILKAGFSSPLLFDGGVGDKLPAVLAMGGAGILKSQALCGGTIEQPGGMYFIRDREGRWAKNYSGEAANRTKWGGEKTDYLGEPLFVEGADECTPFNPLAPTITENTYHLLQSLATAHVFAHVDSVRGYHQMGFPPIGHPTAEAAQRASVHHRAA